MFKLVNEYGNITVTVSSESDRDRLIRSGYRLVETGKNSAVKKKTADKG